MAFSAEKSKQHERIRENLFIAHCIRPEWSDMSLEWRLFDSLIQFAIRYYDFGA